MNSSVFKIAIAFVAGLTLALAGALVYVRMQDKHAVPTAIQVRSEPAADASHLPEPTSDQDQKSKPATVSTIVKSATHVTNKVKKAAAPKPPSRPTKQDPVLVVENKPIPPVISPPTVRPPDLAMTHPPIQEPTSAPAETGSSLPVSQAPHVVQLPAGTTLAIRLGEALSSDHNYVGDTFRGVLAQQIVIDGFIIADRESKVLGRVVAADRAGRVKGVSNLAVTLTEINTTDGQRITVETNSVDKQGQKSTGSDTAKIAGGAALGALIGALGGGGKGAAIGAGAGGAAGTGVVLATRGKPATLPNESQLTFVLTTPVTITEQIHH